LLIQIVAVLAEDTDRDVLIKQLSLLEGEWEVTLTAMSMRPNPADVVKGHATFHWLENSHLMVYKSACPGTEFPSSLAVIGFDEIARSFVELYTDSRNVSRIQTMTISPRLWTMERISPGFSQRFWGVISEDGNTIDARLEKREDEGNWAHDFDMRFTRKEG
jgi:hypothetical protein